MTDKEKMQKILDNCLTEPSFTEIVLKYLRLYKPDLYNLNKFYNDIHKYYMLEMSELEKCVGIARENAQYVCLYLKGELYTDEEYAKQCLPLQIEHAEKVVKLLDE